MWRRHLGQLDHRLVAGLVRDHRLLADDGNDLGRTPARPTARYSLATCSWVIRQLEGSQSHPTAARVLERRPRSTSLVTPLGAVVSCSMRNGGRAGPSSGKALTQRTISPSGRTRHP